MEAEITFYYQGNKINIQCKTDQKMKEILEKFANKYIIDINNLIFLYSAELLNLEDNPIFENLANREDKERNKMDIIVYNRNTNIVNQNNANDIDYGKKSTNIICPICQENCRMSIINYKIIFYECKNKHKINNFFLQNFNNTQLIYESNIKCSNCNNTNKRKVHDNLFYKCLTCDQNLCPLCNKEMHNKEHKTIDYDKKNYICKIHNLPYSLYCKDCITNLCLFCYPDHEKTHTKIDYKDILPNKDKINEIHEKINELRTKIDKFNQIINEMIDKLQKVKDNMEIFYQINYNILNDYKIEYNNYQIIENYNDIINNIKMNNIDDIINDDNDINRFKKIINIYDKMFKKEDNHDIIIKEEKINKMAKEEDNLINEEEQNYKKLNSTKINEDKKYTQSRKNSLYNSVSNKLYNKSNNKNQISDKKDGKKVDDKPKVKEKKYVGRYSFKPINDESQKDKNKIKSDKNINKFNKNKIDEDKNKIEEEEILEPNEVILKYKISKNDKKLKIFGKNFVNNNSQNCTIKFDDKILKIVENIDITKDMKNKEVLEIRLKAINITNMSYMLHDCRTLISLSNNSTLDTSKVIDMSYMFYNCNCLSSLNCISKWNTSNVTNMSYMFHSCVKLKTLPDISNWDTSNVTLLTNIFQSCYELSSLPDISKWNTSKVTKMSYMFESCLFLESIPDISKWDISKVNHLDHMFENCSKLKNMPDISVWDISKVDFKYDMFKCCNAKNPFEKPKK